MKLKIKTNIGNDEAQLIALLEEKNNNSNQFIHEKKNSIEMPLARYYISSGVNFHVTPFAWICEARPSNESIT